MRPISVTATPAWCAAALKRGKLVRRQRQHDLVVVAAAERRFHHRRIGGDRRADRIGERHARDVDLGGDAGSAAQLGEIAGEAVGHIHRRRSVLQNRIGQRIARLAARDNAA